MDILFSLFAVSCFFVIFSTTVLVDYERFQGITSVLFLIGVTECMASTISVLLMFAIPLSNWLVALVIGQLFVIPFVMHMHK